MASYSFKNSLFLFLLYTLDVVTVVHTLTHSTATLCHDHERSALLHFKQSLSLNVSVSIDSSAYSKTESWKVTGENTTDCCSWHGVECDDKTGYIIGLHLSSSFLYGILHSNSTVFSLVHLQTLNLADNDFQNSTIPREISHLSSLSRLNLSLSVFSGPIPAELSKMFKLTSLDLSNNNFHGIFPIDIFLLPHMLSLNVVGNQYLTGYLPEFNQTSSLKELALYFTNFSGNLPISIGSLQSLTILKLGECYFSGSIPASIGNLTELTYLSLSNNMLDRSNKLSWLDKLTKLSFLDLDHTNLYGEIPSSFSNHTQLTHLYLGSNHFAGEIPLWLMNMTQLNTLSFRNNELTGNIPSSFSQLKNLQNLDLSVNKLVGTVEADIFLGLTKLTFLSLSSNKITLLTHHHINFTHAKFKTLQLVSCNLKTFPYFLKFQSNLEVLFLEENNIHHKIPLWIWNVSDHLEAIAVNRNFLTSMELNSTVLPSKSLRVIDISNNMLQGNLPILPPKTILLFASFNRLSGHIPPKICSQMSLKFLDLSYNNMSGRILPCLDNSLEDLVLQGNNFSGPIPQTYSKECKLKVMDLSQNQFTEIPKSLSNCKMLRILDLSDNQIEQPFPIWLERIPQLQVLLLHSNKFHGAMGSPESRLGFPMLRILDLSGNFLTGNLPVEYILIWNTMKISTPEVEPYINVDVNFKTRTWRWSIPYIQGSITLTNKGVKRKYQKISNVFTAIDLSSNKFTGQIPKILGRLEALQMLDLSNNELTGPIPQSLTSLTQLESLDLSQNKLSGVIPQQLASQLHFLAFFNVSYNLLSGRIPRGSQFETFENISYVGNSRLCGVPLKKNCGTVHLFPADTDQKDEEDNEDFEFPSGYDWIFILAGTGAGLIVGFVVGNIITDRYSWRISWLFYIIGRMLKNPKRRKRQIIRN
ncbi:receptor-like protein 49 [Apium graveolens]|uniref:receptor-like protein 49 n=1 Tax=Apium graveolens TaxID=4045 RepID=UPI003D799C66